MRFTSWGTTTSFSTGFSLISSYQTSTSTRRLRARPSSVALLATRPAVAHPFVGDGLGRKPQGALEIFGDGARPLPREPDVVAVPRYQLSLERQVVGMADEVETHVFAAAHAVEHAAKTLEIVLGNLGLPQGEEDGRDQVVELDRFDHLLDDLALFGAVPLVLLENGGVLGPEGKTLVGRQVHLDRLAAPGRLPHPRGGLSGRQGGRPARRQDVAAAARTRQRQKMARVCFSMDSISRLSEISARESRRTRSRGDREAKTIGFECFEFISHHSFEVLRILRGFA